MAKSLGISVVLGAVLALLVAGGAADVVTLKGGQVLEGKVKESDDKVLLTTPYATVIFSADEVSGIEYAPSPLEVFEKRAAEIADDDADGHFQLGLYAEQKGLTKGAAQEFEKALAADPDHDGARAKLGFVRRDGQWLSHDEAMAARGLVSYRGRWVTEEEAEALSGRDRALLRRREALLLVRTLTYMIRRSAGREKLDQQDKLSGVSDPAALQALIDATQDHDPSVRSAALLAMENFREDDAALAALNAAMYDPNSEIRYQARIILNKKQNEKAFNRTLWFLSINNGQTRFSASEVLGGIGDPRAVPYLIEYLSWTGPQEQAPARASVRDRNVVRLWSGRPRVIGYRAKVAPGVVGTEPIIARYDRTNRRWVEWGDREPDRWEDFRTDVPEVVLNYEALQALQAITGENFRFDKDAWRAWYLANARNLRKFPLRP